MDRDTEPEAIHEGEQIPGQPYDFGLPDEQLEPLHFDDPLPLYVQALVRAHIHGTPLDFQGARVPRTVQRLLEAGVDGIGGEIGGDECGDLEPGDEDLPLAGVTPVHPAPEHLIAISPAGGVLTMAVDHQTMRRIADQLRVVGEARYTAWNPWTRTEETVVFKPREAL